MSRVGRDGDGDWDGDGRRLVLASGLALAALAVAVLVVPAGRDPAARSSIPAGTARMSDADLTAAVRAGGSIRAIVGATGVSPDGLAAALDAHRADRRVVVRYRADRPAAGLRAVTAVAVDRVADAVAEAERRAAADRVRAAQVGAARATAALGAHERATGVVDPESALADADAQLATLRASRDQAVATGNESASSLEQQVAKAQQRRFELVGVATRRATLVADRRRAAETVDVAIAARRQVDEPVDARTRAEPRVVVEPATSGPLAAQVGLAAVLLVPAALVAVLGVIGSIRRRRDRSPPASPTRNAPPARPGADERTPRIALDEIARRLEALQEATRDAGDVAPDDGPRVEPHG